MKLKSMAIVTAIVVVGLQLATGTALAGLRTVAFSASTYTRIESATSVSVTVTVTEPVASPSKVDYATADGTAHAGSDYTAKSGTLNYSPGQTTKTFTVSLTNDAAFEDDETFTVMLSNASGDFSLGSPTTATVTIQEDDAFVNVDTESVSDSYAESAGTAIVKIALTEKAGDINAVSVAHEVTFHYATGGGTATAGSDYSAVSGTETIPADYTGPPLSISIPIVDDSAPEGDETFKLTFSAVVGAQLGNTSVATVTITDNDTSGQTLAFNASGATVGEGAGSATVTVTRSGGTSGTTTVAYATGGGTATAGSDYTSTSGTLTFTAGQSSKTIVIPITNDSAVESNETFTVTLSAPTGAATLGSQTTSTVTITDDDGTAAVLAFSSSAYSVSEAGLSVTITVTRSGSAGGNKSVDYQSTDGSATAGSDYTAAAGTLTFAGTDTTKTFDVLISDDAAVEGSETVMLTLSNPSGSATLGISSATLTIADDDTVAVETHARTVSLRLRRHLKAKGTVSVADGTHGCYRNVTVKIQRRKSGTWKTIRKTVTDSRGSYKTAIADKTGRYRAKVAKITLDNGDFCSKDKSGTKRHRH